MKTCANCIYKDRDLGDNPCRTCMPSGDDKHLENWTGVEVEEGELKFNYVITYTGAYMTTAKSIEEAKAEFNEHFMNESAEIVDIMILGEESKDESTD